MLPSWFGANSIMKSRWAYSDKHIRMNGLRYTLSLLLLAVAGFVLPDHITAQQDAVAGAPKSGFFARFRKTQQPQVSWRELSLDENLSATGVKPKQHDRVAAVQERMSETWRKVEGVSLRTVAGGEVVEITVPVSELFAPNSGQLDTQAAVRLFSEFLPVWTQAGYYHIMVAAYSDNTGSDDYLSELTSQRAEAVVAWLGDQGVASDDMVSYGMGAGSPVASNDSMAGRAKNRRLVFYLLPGKDFVRKSARLGQEN